MHGWQRLEWEHVGQVYAHVWGLRKPLLGARFVSCAAGSMGVVTVCPVWRTWLARGLKAGRDMGEISRYGRRWRKWRGGMVPSCSLSTVWVLEVKDFLAEGRQWSLELVVLKCSLRSY